MKRVPKTKYKCEYRLRLPDGSETRIRLGELQVAILNQLADILRIELRKQP